MTYRHLELLLKTIILYLVPQDMMQPCCLCLHLDLVPFLWVNCSPLHAGVITACLETLDVSSSLLSSKAKSHKDKNHRGLSILQGPIHNPLRALEISHHWVKSAVASNSRESQALQGQQSISQVRNITHEWEVFWSRHDHLVTRFLLPRDKVYLDHPVEPELGKSIQTTP